MSFKNKIIVILCIAITAITLPMHSILNRPNISSGKSAFAKVVIDKGDNLAEIANKLKTAKLVDSHDKFIWACRILRMEKGFPAGVFTIPYGLSNRELIRRMLFYGANTGNVTIKEGWRAEQIAGKIAKKIGVDSTAFMEAVRDSVFIKELGIEAPSLEGYLFPETYNLYLGAEPREAIKKMVAQFKKVFEPKLKYRAYQMGFSINQIITLASIIEGEIIFSSEAPLVSAVYHNRLKQGMRLQADPTIQYIITDGPRRLKYSDLKIDSPYNTYRRKGLPPGPVGNPGRRAIMAALYPAKVPYIYFVAKGDGYHYFNVTAEEHLADKRKFDEYRKKVARKRKNLN